MFKKLNKEMKREHSGFGGMIFLTITLFSALTMLFLVRLSFNSTTKSELDQIAFFEATKAANWLYINNPNVVFYDQDVSQPLKSADGKSSYDLVAHYNESVKKAGLSDSNSVRKAGQHYYTSAFILSMHSGFTGLGHSTNSGNFSVQYPPVKNKLGQLVRPSQTNVAIESNT